jgi:hypothetical protein
MTRKSSTLIISLIVLAAALVPASAFADGYQSVSAIVGPGESSSDDGYSSVNALAAASPDLGASELSATVGSSPNAILGAHGVPEPAPQLVEVGDDDGFNWSDALIGALIGSTLIVMTLAAARLVARHRRTTAESRA